MISLVVSIRIDDLCSKWVRGQQAVEGGLRDLLEGLPLTKNEFEPTNMYESLSIKVSKINFRRQ